MNGTTKSGTTGADGKFTVDVTGMTAPFLIKVTQGDATLYSVATSAGTANIHPFTDLIIRNWFKAKGSDVDTVFAASGAISPAPTDGEIDVVESVIKDILTDLLLSAAIDPADFNLITTPFDADAFGFDNVLDRTQVVLVDDNVAISEVDPATGTASQTIFNAPIAIDLTSAANPVSTAKDAINANLAVFKDLINARNCNLAAVDIEPYFEAGFLGWGQDLDAMAGQFKWMVCTDSAVTDTVVGFTLTEVISYDDVQQVLRGRMLVSRASGNALNQVLDFKFENNQWVVAGNGEIVETEVRSRWSRHIRSGGTTESKFLNVEIGDYRDVMGSATVSGPGISGSYSVPKICEETDPANLCSDLIDSDPTPWRYFRAQEQENLAFPYAGAVFTVTITKQDSSTVNYVQIISALPGSYETDFPTISGISTHSLADVAGTTITANVWTPLWVGEVAPPFVILWNNNVILAVQDGEWVGTPAPGQVNTFSITIPAEYDGQAVTQAVLGQDAQYAASKGWGRTDVYWYFE